MQKDFGTFVHQEDHREQLAFNGSFSGFERSVFYQNPGKGGRYIESAHGLGLGDDQDGRAVAPIDIDGDGDLDLAILSLQSLRIMLNQAPKRSFVRVRLRATKSEPLALGAVVQIEAGGRAQLDRMRLTAGFHTQVLPEVHFGLGGARAVDALEVRWPSGAVQRFADLPADRLITIVEGEPTPKLSIPPRWPPGTAPRVSGARLGAPALALDGTRAPLATPGRAAVINFWAPWCAACEREMPALVGLAKTLGDEAQVVGVSIETKDRAGVEAFAARHGVQYPIRLATDALMEAFFGPAAEVALPVTFVFDARGTLRRAFYREVRAEEVRAVLRATPAASFEDFVELSTEAFDRNDHGGARRHLAEALRLGMDDRTTIMHAAQLYMRMRDPLAAREMLDAAVRHAPEMAEYWALLSAARGMLGDMKGAQAAVDRALVLAPRNPIALNSAGMLLQAEGRLDEAAARFRAALDADPNYIMARANLRNLQRQAPPPR